jgi:hypothetical protein
MVSSLGQPIGNPFWLDTGIGSAVNIDLAFNRSRNEFLAVYESDEWFVTGWETNIQANIIYGDGTPKPSQINIYTDRKDQKSPSVAAIPTAPHKGQYLVVYEHYHSPTDIDIHGRKVTGEGNFDDFAFVISNTTFEEKHPTVAGNEDADQYLVAWKKGTATHPVIQVQEIDRSGIYPLFLLDGDLISAGADHGHPAISSGPSGDFLVAFEASNLDYGIFGHIWGIRLYLPLSIQNR